MQGKKISKQVTCYELNKCIMFVKCSPNYSYQSDPSLDVCCLAIRLVKLTNMLTVEIPSYFSLNFWPKYLALQQKKGQNLFSENSMWES